MSVASISIFNGAARDCGVAALIVFILAFMAALISVFQAKAMIAFYPLTALGLTALTLAFVIKA